MMKLLDIFIIRNDRQDAQRTSNTASAKPHERIAMSPKQRLMMKIPGRNVLESSLLINVCIALFCVLLMSSCAAKNTPKKAPADISKAEAAKLDTAYFAEGCFWCAEAVFQRVKGVADAISGYSGGTKPNPTYEEVGSETTNYAESVQVLYDPNVVSYKTLLKVFFGSQDPTQADGQGPDIGRSYRSIIFYQNKQEKKAAEEMKKETAGQYNKPIAVEITPFKKFYKAEAYHQEYFANHPNDPYIVHESKPRVARFMKKLPQLLKDEYKK